jgi:hypothetical protein
VARPLRSGRALDFLSNLKRWDWFIYKPTLRAAPWHRDREFQSFSHSSNVITFRKDSSYLGEKLVNQKPVASSPHAYSPDYRTQITPTVTRVICYVHPTKEELRPPMSGTFSGMVCRCEDIPFSRSQPHSSWRAAKLLTRSRMRACQGRICGPATKFLFDWNPESVRPPIFPACVESLAAVAGSAER